MSEQLIKVEKEDRIITLKLDNPARRNAISFEMADEIARAVEEIKKDKDALAVIITGEGKGFSSGGDVRSMNPPKGEGVGDGDIAAGIKGYYKNNLSVMDIPIPTIAAINGHAIGAGFTLALACDMRIASKKAKLALGFVKIGLHPGMGTTWFVPRIVGMAKAYELLLTGETINGEEAERIGLVNKAVEPEEVMNAAKELALKIANGPAIPIRAMKRSIGDSLSRTLEETLDLEAKEQVICAKTEDLIEGIKAFIERRDPVFKGK